MKRLSPIQMFGADKRNVLHNGKAITHDQSFEVEKVEDEDAGKTEDDVKTEENDDVKTEDTETPPA